MVINGIDTKDISVVVQGPIVEATANCIESIRTFLPDAKIILSTWKNQKISNLSYDILIENDDPGAFPCDALQHSVMNNINRQLVSTQQGLRQCTTTYAMKMRSDFYLTSTDFIMYFKKYKKFNSDFHFFKERIVGCTVYSRNPRSKIGILTMPYCPSDFFFFGFLDDLKRLYDRELITDVDEKMFFELHSDMQKHLNYKDALCKFMPEQSIWMGFLKKHIDDLDCLCRDHITEKNIILTEKSFANNLVLCSNVDLGICSASLDLFYKGIPENCLTHDNWENLYKFYCEGDVVAYDEYLNDTKRRDKEYLSGKRMKQNSVSKDFLKKEENIFREATSSTINKMKEVLPLIDKYQYVSFDIFDTLLHRKTAPDWQAMAQSSEYICMLLSSKGISTSVSEIDRLRNQYAEYYGGKSIAKGGSNEYRIRDVIKAILRLYGCTELEQSDLCTQICHNEVLREQASIYLNPEIREVLAYLKNKKKKIIAISDMYLSEKDIRMILDKLEITNFFEKIYISSESQMTKADGKLYDYVLEDLNIQPSKILHIGDNEFSDVRKANQYGIDSVYYLNKENIQRKQSIENQVLTSTNKEYIIEELNLAYEPKTFEEYIQSYFSYDIINFVYDLARKASKENIETLFFLERDGTLYGEIYEQLKNKILLFKDLNMPKCVHIKVSRKDTACLINIKNIKEVIDRAYRVNPPNRFHLIHILGCFGIELSDFSEEDQIEFVDHNSDPFYFEEIYHSIIYPKLYNRQRKVLTYLKQSGFFDSNRMGIVDIGWGGTSQRDIATYLQKELPDYMCYGFYYACDDRAQALAPYYSQYHYGPDLYYSYSLQEFIVKKYTSSLEDLKISSIKYPELKQTLQLNYAARIQIKSDINCFANAVNRLHLTPELIRQVTFARLKKMVDDPPNEFVMMLTEVCFSLDRKKDDSFLPLFEATTSFSKLQEQYDVAQWIQATINISDMKLKKALSYREKYQRLMNSHCIPLSVKKLLILCKDLVKKKMEVE